MQFDAIKELSLDGPLTVKIDGDCMAGSIPNGASVKIKRSRFYWPGDVVVFGRGDDRLVTHRFLGYTPTRRGWCGVTRSDDAAEADAPVTVVRILGKVMSIEQVAYAPGLGKRLGSCLAYCVYMFRRAGGLLTRFLKSIGILR